MNYQTFNDLHNYIAAWETFSAKPYYATDDERDRGILTIGYGFTYPDKKRAIQLGQEECPAAMTSSEASIKLIFKIDCLTKILGLPTVSSDDKTKHINDALLSLAYNMGPKSFPRLLECLHSGDDTGAYNEFFNGIYQSKMPLEGLIYRRACDAQIFNKGIYEKRDYITPPEKALFLKMNVHNQNAIDMINNKVKMEG